MKFLTDRRFIILCFRPGAVHERTERVDTSTGESSDRAIAEHELDGCFQSSDHGAPYALLRQ